MKNIINKAYLILLKYVYLFFLEYKFRGVDVFGLEDVKDISLNLKKVTGMQILRSLAISTRNMSISKLQ